MRTIAFASRNQKELLRDPLTLGFGLGFPLVLLALLSLIQRNIPVPMFEIETLAPGVAAFGLTFIALFAALLVSKDRSRSFMMRLCASPMRAGDFILGYLIPLAALALAQVLICLTASAAFGMKIGANILLAALTLLPAAMMYIAIGLICGTLLNDKQVGGVCGAALTNVCAWLSGIWFDLALLGEGFSSFAKWLPFAAAVDAARGAIAGAVPILPLVIVCGWAFILMILAIFLFRSRMKSGKI